MSNPFDHFNDDLDAPAASSTPMPSVAKGEAGEGFVETCPKCRGTGRFISYSGRVLGNCFTCRGKGKQTFASSPEARAKSRERATVVRARKLQQRADSIKDVRATHAAEIAWLERAAKRNSERAGLFTFPQDVLNKLEQYGSITDGQLAAVQRLMAKDADRAAASFAAAPEVNATKIEKAFEVAREKADRPGQQGTFVKPLNLTSPEPDPITLAFRPGTPGTTWDGMLFVKRDDRKLGHIKGGKFFKKYDCTDAEAKAIVACAEDPETAVIAYAKAWKACGICNRLLLKDVSIERGIGPTCASKFGWAF